MDRDIEEFVVRAAASSSTSKKHSVFKSHKDDNITWTEVRMRRENDSQPWQIKHGTGKTGRRFKTIKEGGVNENASYFVFYKSNDKSDTYEVCPVDDWYSISATQRYRTLTAEEAEQKFEERHKTLNHFSVMYKKKNGENGDDTGHDKRSFKISEMEEWDNSGDDDFSGDNDADNEGDESRKKSKARKRKDKEEPEDAPDEGKEDSDEGDFEQREVDYMSDSSSESSDGEVEKDMTDVKGIAEEEALRDLLSTDDEEDGENPQQKSKSNDNKSTHLGTVDSKADADGSDGDASSDSEDYDVDEDKMDSIFAKKGLPTQLNALVKTTDEPDSGASQTKATTNTSSGSKRKAPTVETSTHQTAAPPIRRPRTVEPPAPSQAVSNEEKIVEDLIKKYLGRKAMTPKDLLIQIKSKFRRMSGVTPEMNDRIVELTASVIRRLQLDNQKINDVTYLSLRS